MKSRIHFLNVDPGACTLIEHASGRISMVDICCGHQPDRKKKTRQIPSQPSNGSNNFRMRYYSTNPISYLRELGITSLFRFILSHPDMDHMDGLDALFRAIPIYNFWHTGVTKEVPNFSNNCRYKQSDWSKYQDLCYQQSDIHCMTPLAGARFAYANQDHEFYSEGDSLYILAPNQNLLSNSDINNSSYVILYNSPVGKIILAGDSHDDSWEYIIRKYSSEIKNCAVLLAPHHGRSSNRSYKFLDHLQPRLTIFGSAPSEHLAYGPWRNRNLKFITANQAGNIVLELDQAGINIFIENEEFASAKGLKLYERNDQNYIWFDQVENSRLTLQASSSVGLL